MNTYQNTYTGFPEMTMDEYNFIQEASSGLNSYQMQTFMLVYNSRRKNPLDILFATLFGFLGLAGVQRFMTKQYAWGVLYLLTGGFFLLGTIVDLLTYRIITNEYNKALAFECYNIARAGN
jgi:TM2 domain-containing membrane protein YozV